jgi:prepilin-type N-terminal cleavage/methylation domain-containing protein/prepilin-type processing-associated H-X9-DG protein
MRKSDPDLRRHGFTLVELLVVIVVIYILVVMLTPRLSGPTRAKVPLCLNHLRQIDLGLFLFASDHHDQFPMQFPAANGGRMELADAEHIFPEFEKLKSYSIQPGLFICPFETNRQAAVNFEALKDTNLSYFINRSAAATNAPRSILTGDRFLRISGKPVKPGLLILTTNVNVSWAPGFHNDGGGIAFADGHTEFTQGKRLPRVISEQPLTTNRLCIP